MYYILIDPAIPLSEIVKLESVLVSLLMEADPKVLIRYKGVPFATNIPIGDNVLVYMGNTGLINGDFTGISLYGDESIAFMIDMLMAELFKNKIMSMVIKVDQNIKLC